jgi:hypothetical protein
MPKSQNPSHPGGMTDTSLGSQTLGTVPTLPTPGGVVDLKALLPSINWQANAERQNEQSQMHATDHPKNDHGANIVIVVYEGIPYEP